MLLIDAAHDLAVVDVLVLGDFGKGCAHFIILSFYLAILDGVVMDHEVSGQDQHLLLTEEPHAEQIGLRNRISLHEFELLQIDIEEYQLIFPLD